MRNKNKNRVFRFNRRNLNLTNYQKRLRLLKGGMVRIIIRRSNNNTLVQFAVYEESGDKLISSGKSENLKKMGMKIHTGNLTSGYLTGFLAGKRYLSKAKDKNSEVILDTGLFRHKKGSRIYSALKGAVDSGVKIRCDESIFPSENRIKGEHLKNKISDKDFESLLDKVSKL